MTDRLADNELSFTHPPGWEDLTDEQKKQEAEKAIEAAHNGIRVEANSIASFAVASTVEQSLNKSGKKKTALPASVSSSGFVKYD